MNREFLYKVNFKHLIFNQLNNFYLPFHEMMKNIIKRLVSVFL
jgi:hypothetical protein